MSETNQTLDMLKGVYTEQNPLAKAGNTVTTASGLINYDLQAPAKNLYPVITIISKRIPRVKGKGGTATNWRVVNSISGGGYGVTGWVPEGQRSGVMGISTANKAATYATLGQEAALTFEAQSAAEGFEDERSRNSIRVLQQAMLSEESAILGGNASLALGTPAAPSLSAAGTGATLPAATYSVIGVQLTYEGLQNSSVANGVATSKTVSGQDGNTYSLSGGSSNKSANATQAVTLGQTLTATCTPKAGAVGYAWYVGTAANETLQAITSLPTATFSAPLASGTQAATAVTADNSANANTAYDGLLTQAFNPANGAYVNNLNGALMTSSGRGSVNEIDTVLKTLWDEFRVSPSVMYVSSQEQRNITSKVLNGASAPLLRFNTDGKAPLGIVANGVVEYYYNPYALNGGNKIEVVLHPTMPPGTILFHVEHLPAQYQSNEVPQVAEMHVRRDWYEIEWPLVTRSYQHGIYVEEVLAVYAPFGLAILSGIGNG